MRIGRVFVYRLFRTAFVLGISIDVSDHVHEPDTNELCITLECLIWGMDIQIQRNAPYIKENTMRTVWKYPLYISDVVTLEMPEDSEPLCVQPQGGNICLWALVDPDAEKEGRYFRVVGTGHDLECDDAVYVDTFQLRDLVFHVFEIKP